MKVLNNIQPGHKPGFFLSFDIQWKYHPRTRSGLGLYQGYYIYQVVHVLKEYLLVVVSFKVSGPTSHPFFCLADRTLLWMLLQIMLDYIYINLKVLICNSKIKLRDNCRSAALSVYSMFEFSFRRLLGFGHVLNCSTSSSLSLCWSVNLKTRLILFYFIISFMFILNKEIDC